MTSTERHAVMFIGVVVLAVVAGLIGSLVVAALLLVAFELIFLPWAMEGLWPWDLWARRERKS